MGCLAWCEFKSNQNHEDHRFDYGYQKRQLWNCTAISCTLLAIIFIVLLVLSVMKLVTSFWYPVQWTIFEMSNHYDLYQGRMLSVVLASQVNATNPLFCRLNLPVYYHTRAEFQNQFPLENVYPGWFARVGTNCGIDVFKNTNSDPLISIVSLLICPLWYLASESLMALYLIDRLTRKEHDLEKNNPLSRHSTTYNHSFQVRLVPGWMRFLSCYRLQMSLVLVPLIPLVFRKEILSIFKAKTGTFQVGYINDTKIAEQNIRVTAGVFDSKGKEIEKLFLSKEFEVQFKLTPNNNTTVASFMKDENSGMYNPSTGALYKNFWFDRAQFDVDGVSVTLTDYQVIVDANHLDLATFMTCLSKTKELEALEKLCSTYQIPIQHVVGKL